MTDPVSLEIHQRQEGEKSKALEKYGPDALLPGGRPEFDILDFLINEVIGLRRYGEMVQHRFMNDDELFQLGADMVKVSDTYARPIVAARQRLLRCGEMHETGGKGLGIVERERMSLPDNA